MRKGQERILKWSLIHTHSNGHIRATDLIAGFGFIIAIIDGYYLVEAKLPFPRTNLLFNVALIVFYALCLHAGMLALKSAEEQNPMVPKRSVIFIPFMALVAICLLGHLLCVYYALT